MKKSKCQILITGNYRSGTEYFTNLLNCHPRINASMYRVNYLRFIYKKYNLKTEKEKLINDLSIRIFERYKIKLNKKSILKKIKNKSDGEIYDILMTNLYLKNDKDIWAEKCQLLWRDTAKFIKIMRNPKIIHILRDPRAVMVSFKKYTKYQPPAYLGSGFNSVDAMGSILKDQRRYKKKFICIKYEDLIEKKIDTMNKVYNFLNVKPFHKYNHEKFKDAYGNKWIVNSSFEKKLKNPFHYDFKKINNIWKSKLSYEDINFVETICEKKYETF